MFFLNFKFYFWLLYVAIGLPTFASSIRIIMELRYKNMFLKHFLALQKLCCHDFFLNKNMFIFI